MKQSQTLAELYQSFRKEPEQDIAEHLPTLKGLARQCQHVTEFGVRGGVSTTALLLGCEGQVVSYDLERHPNVELIQQLYPPWQFHQEDVLQTEIQETDLLFIDTWHVYEQLRAELKKHAAKVRHWIVLHDTETFGERGESPGHRGLGYAVWEFLEQGTFVIAKHYPNNNGLTVLRRVKPEPPRWKDEPAGARIYLGIPYYQEVHGQAVDSWSNALDPHGPDSCATFYAGGAFHCRNFNQLWASALNTRQQHGWTHFAMIHHDVRPEGYWLGRMLQEMQTYKADVLSVVLPIKTHHGLTSTAVVNRHTKKVRRVCLHEAHLLPETFSCRDFSDPNLDLLLSTGLWICDFTKPWVEDMWFEVRDRILKHPEGDYRTETISEDWHFSHILNRLGLKLMATRCVPCGHWGPAEFRNDSPWGTWKSDLGATGTFGDWHLWPRPGESQEASPCPSSTPSPTKAGPRPSKT